MALFQEVLSNSRNVVVVAGAGLSAASGVPTFRGAEGLWKTYNVAELENLNSFEQNPIQFWRFYNFLRDLLLKAKPNKAHLALAEWSLLSNRDKLMPENKGTSFTLITQNIDGLSTISLNQVTSRKEDTKFNPDESQPPLVELHGRLLEMMCTNTRCSRRSPDAEWPVLPPLNGETSSHTTTTASLSDTIPDESSPEIPELIFPRCDRCGSLCRPGDVWFGEQPLHARLVNKIIHNCDLCIVVGTSSTVYPAAGYPPAVKRNGGRIAVFNTERTAGDGSAEFLFLGPCEETLPKALGLGRD